MKAILASHPDRPLRRDNVHPCPRPIDAPPIRLTIINTQTPASRMRTPRSNAD